MFISILLLFMFILLIYYYYVHYGRNGRLLHLLPGPPSIPIFGHSFLFQVSAGMSMIHLWRFPFPCSMESWISSTLFIRDFSLWRKE